MHEFQRDFLVEDSKSDKIHHHGYHRIYPWFLKHFKDKEVRLLEVGIHETESMRLWRGYFSKLIVHGLDIDEKTFDDPNVELHRVDQSKEGELKAFIKSVGSSFDIIIDDGSHVPAHQILTLNHLWTLLSPGGIYIVEDIETSYWGKSSIYGYDFNAKSKGSNFVKFAAQLIDIVNSEFSKKTSTEKGIGNFEKEIEMVTFAYNCVIFVKKDLDSFSQYYNRDYKRSHKINSRSLYRRVPFLRRFFKRLNRYLKTPNAMW